MTIVHVVSAGQESLLNSSSEDGAPSEPEEDSYPDNDELQQGGYDRDIRIYSHLARRVFLKLNMLYSRGRSRRL